MSNEIEKALNIIQFKTNKSLDEIAEIIGRTRPYLSSAKKKGKPESLVGRLKMHFPEELQEITFGNNSSINETGLITEGELIDIIIQNNAMLSVSLDAMAEILATSSKKTVSEARSSLAKAVEYRIEILKGSGKS